MDLAFPFLFALWAFSGKAAPAPTRRPPRVPTPRTGPHRHARVVRRPPPAPWRLVVPVGLPNFPGSGWEPDEPPPGLVVARAQQLLRPLWRRGVGTSKIEQTAGRWIAYRATRMGTKKGVVAWRPKPGAVKTGKPRRVRPPPAHAPHPGHVIVRAGRAVIHKPKPSPPSLARTPSTIRRGSSGGDVRLAQTKLGLTPDGIFGPKTERRVRAYQKLRRLQVDGIVGPKTWRSLLGTRP